MIVVSIDGLRPDAIDHSTRTLRHLSREGTVARQAQTITHSSTLPSHAAMLSGFDVDRHGLDFNAYRPDNGRIRVPSVFSLARARGLSTTLVVGKRKLEHILHEGDAELFRIGGIFCHRVNAIAVPNLASARAGVHFVHYSDVDAAGHRHGWMSPRYHQAVHRVDRCLGELVQALRMRGDLDRTLLVVTADHGGHGRSHGSERQSDMRIPWIAWGGAARSGARVEHVDTRDTAATIIEALHLARPEGIDGRPVLAALRP